MWTIAWDSLPLLFWFRFVLCQHESVHVHSNAGNIVGFANTTSFESVRYNVNTFLGIPFAEPPLGVLRFAKPIKKARFTHAFSATKYGPACPQKAEFSQQWIPGKPMISEDCLTLNVFAPAHAHNLAVMVWFHGGAFVIGQSSIYDASTLSGFGNVVVVTANYRLGPIGFLATDDDTAKGNYGLWDQHMALQWVHDNIASFGGDPNLVTVFGESAGGASSFFQAIYPSNKGLMKRIISESGTAICPWAYSERATVGRYSKLLGMKLNCSVATNVKLVNCLRTKPFEDLIANAQVGTKEDEIYRPEWTPVVDGEFVKQLPPDAFLYPETMFSEGRDTLADLDLLIGINDGDGGFITMVSLLPFVQSKITPKSPGLDIVNNYVTNSILTDRFGATVALLADTMSFVYTKWSKTTTNNTYLQKMLDMSSDYQFFMPAKISARAHTKVQTSGRHTYMYLFTHRSSYAHTIPWAPGAGHGDELPYVFGFPTSMQKGLNFKDTLQSAEVLLSEKIMTYWTNFAKTGDPNKPVAVPLIWPEFDLNSEFYMDLNTTLSIKSKMDATRTAFWTQFAPKALKGIHNFYRPVSNSQQSTNTFDLSSVIG
ncbi:acetylcholinesterase-like [Saccostrea echinata]|uniref:acetylcholinesterase-like n=1 Tax=Saccostrea echinata TaxID=191078 RepID=UPI002A824EAA|nr:acetylcholinesterase-like [Saccostrea echinata]